MRVVLADDSDEMRSLLRWALERDEAIRVLGEAADAASVVGLVTELRPDVLLLDLQMPGMTPGELLEAAARAAPGMSVVTFSGYEPHLVAPDQASLVRLHVPKTTDLALVREAVVGLAYGMG